jgi:hypothetical protein
MAIIGQTSAVLKDLTLIAEDTVKETRPNLVPLISTKLEAEGQAYVKVPIGANVGFPTKLEEESQEYGKLVGYTQEYNNDTYMLKIGLNADLVKDVKAWDFSGVVREASMKSVKFKDYLASLAIKKGVSSVAMADGASFYTASTDHSYAAQKKNKFKNKLSKTGTSVAALFTDLGTAKAAIRGILDNTGYPVNAVDINGPTDLIVQYPLSYDNNMRAVLNAEMIPQAITTAAGSENVGGASMTNTLRNSAMSFADAYLADSDGFFLHYVAMPQKPLAWIQDYDVRVDVLGFGTPNEVLDNKVFIVLKQRFVLGYLAYWRSIQVA